MEQNIKDMLCKAIQEEDSYFDLEIKAMEWKLYGKVMYDELCERYNPKKVVNTYE